MRLLTVGRRLVYPALVAIMVGGAAVTYQTKENAVAAADRVAELRHLVERERIALSLLNAEWSVLTQPSRLQDLVDRHPEDFQLASYGIERVVRIDALPWPEPDENDVLGRLIGGVGR
ncbi:MAG: hypothetical protein KIS96_08415 [Bauldia sp.]|nr:hypothetical protein [Bauldia sp.]